MSHGDHPSAHRTRVEDHARRVTEALEVLRARDPEPVSLPEALGRVLAHDVVSGIDLPPFRNSQMDGFAVRAVDVASVPVSLPIVGEVAAAPGKPSPLAPGTAVRIMTGATVPEGADAVIPVEDVNVESAPDGGESVLVTRARSQGQYIREPGSDLGAGERVLAAGTVLGSRHLAALAAVGLSTVDVRSRVAVAVISTGSELVAPGEALGPGQIFDSNRVALSAAVRAAGAEVVFEARASDEVDELARLLDAAQQSGAELVVTSGGVSMGDHEVVRDLLEPRGGRVDVLAMQPGGPQALGDWRRMPVVCFPGNPVSSQLSFELFLAPLLRELAGHPAAVRGTGILSAGLTSIPGRRQYLRGRRLPDDSIAVSGVGSHLVAGLAASDLLVEIPEDVVEVAPGAVVETWEL